MGGNNNGDNLPFNAGKALGFLMMLGLLFSYAGGGGDSIRAGVCALADYAKALMASIVFSLIIVAAIVYAGGQILGAETRSRASVWATAMIVGAVIGIVIFVLLPPILSTMLYGDPNAIQAEACGP